MYHTALTVNLRVIPWSVMSKILSAITLFLLSLPLLAATKELEGASAPADTVDMVWVIVFAVIFIGAIIGFFIYLFMTDKGNKPE